MTADFFLALFSTLPIGHLLGFWQISLTFVTILSFIALIIIMYIVLRYPEALLFSQAKILTCLDLYGKINSLTTEAEIKAFGMPSLVSYIKNLPPDLLEMQLANLQLGLCFGSFTDQGFVIQARNKYCTFSDSQLQSMLEFSAVLYEHGDVNKLYGPFPQVKDRLVRKNVGNYFVFGFHHLDSSVTDTRVVSQGGKTLALVLLFYSHEYDIILSRYKYELVSTLNAAVQSNTTLNSAPAFLTQLQNNIMALFIFEDKPG